LRPNTWLQARFETEISLHRQARFRTQRLLALQYPVVGFLEAAGILAVLLMGAARIQSHDLDSAGFSSYVAALLMLIDPISHLTTNFNEFQQGQASLRRLRAIEAEPIEPADREGAQPLGVVKGELLLDNVFYGYDPAQPVLHGLSLRIQSGQVVALVGPSGAGNSIFFAVAALQHRPAGPGPARWPEPGGSAGRRPAPGDRSRAPAEQRLLRHGPPRPLPSAGR
jgi:ATP-binding cassette subfamily B protein